MSATAASSRVLLVDDEPDLRDLVSLHLSQAGFDVTEAASGEEALDRAMSVRPAVVVLDLMLPDVPGVEVGRRLRATPELEGVGLLMLTARGDEYDRLLGFEVGADDYVVKPFSVRELVHRVRALARRASSRAPSPDAHADAPDVRRWRGLEIDLRRREVRADGVTLTLRPLEYRVLCLLADEPGRVYSRADLLREVWGATAALHTRTVDSHIFRLREALGAYGDAIETVHGFGYRLRDP
jgi:two-component system phosphate regulon response regulator PhoB